MKTYFRIFALMMLVTVVSCAPVKVMTDFDRSIDFSGYQTYSFLGWQDDSDKLLNGFDKKRIRDAFKDEMESRNLRYVEEGGDMDISLFIVLDQKTSVSAYTDYHSRGHYGYNRYNPWGMGHSRTTYSETDYMEGTLVMDVFDSGTKDQIWQAVATSVVSEYPSRRDREIPRKVNALMSEFPVEALI